MNLLLLAACRGSPGGPAAPVDHSAQGDAPECPEGTVADSVTSECVPEACGVGPWAAGLTDESTVFVLAGSGSQGDGTRDAPLSTLSRALSVAEEQGSGVIAVGDGVYGESLEVEASTVSAILGRCPDRVTLDGSGADAPGLRLQGDALLVSGLTLSGGAPGLDQARGVLRASNLRVVGSLGYGIRASGYANESMVLEDVEIDGVLAHDVMGEGVGISVSGTAVLEATGLAVEDAGIFGVVLDPEGASMPEGSSHVLSGVRVSGTRAGHAVDVSGGAIVQAEGLELVDNASVGLDVRGPGTRVTLTDSSISGTAQAEGDTALPVALGVIDSAELTATNLLIEGGGYLAIAVNGAETFASFDSLVVRGVEQVSGQGGVGLHASDGATVELGDIELSGLTEGIEAEGAAHVRVEGATVREVTAIGLMAEDEGTWMEVSGATVLDVGLAEGQHNEGIAVSIHDGARLDLHDSAVEGVGWFGLVAYGGAVLDIDSCDVQGVWGETGAALGVFSSSTLTLVDSTIHDSAVPSIFLSDPDTMADVVGSRFERNGGEAIVVVDGATAAVSDCAVVDAERAGFVATDGGASLVVVDTSVEGVGPHPDQVPSVGIIATNDASVELVRVGLSGVAGPGLVSSAGASARCEDCELVDDQYAGVVVASGSLEFVGGGVEGVSSHAQLAGGVGIHAFAVPGLGPPVLELYDAAVDSENMAALYLSGAGTFDIQGCELAVGVPTTAHDRPYLGAAVFASGGVEAASASGGAGLSLVANHMQSGGPAEVVLSGASARLDGNAYSRTDLNLVQQGCTDGLSEPEIVGEEPRTSLCPASAPVYVDPALVFAFDYEPTVERVDR